MSLKIMSKTQLILLLGLGWAALFVSRMLWWALVVHANPPPAPTYSQPQSDCAERADCIDV